MYVWVSGEFLSKLSSLFSVCIAAVFQEEAKSIYLRVRLPLLVDLTPYSVLLFNHSVVSDSLRPRGPWIAALQASLSITNSQSLLTLTSTESSNHLILCRPLCFLLSVFPSIAVFSNESNFHIRWPKYWSFSFGISPSNEYSGLISFRMDWLDLLAVQGTLKSLLQHHSSEASILQCSAFFMVQLLHSYMTTGKNIALTGWTFVNKNNISAF